MHTGAVQALLNNYESLQMTMDASKYYCSRCANGVQDIMGNFSYYFRLKYPISYSVLQSSWSILSNAIIDESFRSFFEGVHVFPILPRQRQIPRRLDSGSS